VASIQQDQKVKVNALRTDTPLSWGLDRIDQRSPVLDTKFTYDDSAVHPVNVYVLDTGILSSHTQFGGRVIPGYNWVDISDTEDCSGHGTHCTGTIGGKDYGICKHCKLIAVKVMLGCGGEGTWTTIIAGLDWSITHAMPSGIPSVISMSLSGAYNSFVNDMISTAVDLGIVVVVSAGNDNTDASFYSPASSPAAITVGAISLSGTKSSYSNFGKSVDIFAPGDNITSAFIGEGNSNFRDFSGTSMAAPHVAGVAALYRAFNPSKSAYEVRDFIVANWRL
jgi:serine protease